MQKRVFLSYGLIITLLGTALYFTDTNSLTQKEVKKKRIPLQLLI